MAARIPVLRHHGVLIVDIAGFGSRTTRAQLAARQIMRGAMRDALRGIGQNWQPGAGDELGDGLRVLLPESVPMALLAHPLPELLDEALRWYNAKKPLAEQVRLRAAIGTAEVEFDGGFAASPSVIEAFRLVEAPALKRLLARSPGPLAVIASQHFYREVIRRVPGAHPEHYRQVRVRTKEGRTVGWVALPGCQPVPAWRAVVWRSPLIRRLSALEPRCHLR